MGIIREPEGVTFTVVSRPFTKKEKQELSALIAASKNDPVQQAAVKKAKEILAQYEQRRREATVDRIEEQALLLPYADRAKLVHRLVDSLAPEPTAADATTVEPIVAKPAKKTEDVAISKTVAAVAEPQRKRRSSRKTTKATRH